MPWIFDGDLSRPIDDDAPFTGPGGTKYPGNWPKAAVQGMVRVVETERPSDAIYAVSGSAVQLVGGVPTRVWSSTPRTTADLKARANKPVLRTIEEKERLLARPTSELLRSLVLGDVAQGDVDAAKTKLRQIVDDIKALRGQLQ